MSESGRGNRDRHRWPGCPTRLSCFSYEVASPPRPWKTGRSGFAVSSWPLGACVNIAGALLSNRSYFQRPREARTGLGTRWWIIRQLADRALTLKMTFVMYVRGNNAAI